MGHAFEGSRVERRRRRKARRRTDWDERANAHRRVDGCGWGNTRAGPSMSWSGPAPVGKNVPPTGWPDGPPSPVPVRRLMNRSISQGASIAYRSSIWLSPRWR